MKNVYRGSFCLIITYLILQLSIAKLLAQTKTNDTVYLKCVRVYTDSFGESHFEDLNIGLNEIDFAPPAPPIFTSDLNVSTKYGFLSVSPGWESDWHPAPKRQFIIYLSGTIEAEVSDGEVRRIGPGGISLVEDTQGKGHRSRVIGDEEVVAVIIQLEE